MRFKMEAKIVFAFLDPLSLPNEFLVMATFSERARAIFKEGAGAIIAHDIIKVNLKWRRLSHYAEENKNKNFAKFFDQVRLAMEGALDEMKSNGVKGPVTWVYNGFLPDWVHKRLKESKGVYGLKMEGDKVVWSIIL